MAPDAWGVAGLTRGQTHFWSLEDDTSGVVRLGRAYPGLGDPLRRGARERAFLAGYLCHLVTDEQWTFCVYRPFFGRHSVFGASAEGRIVQLALQGEWEQGLRDLKGPPACGAGCASWPGPSPGTCCPSWMERRSPAGATCSWRRSRLPAARLAFRYVLGAPGRCSTPGPSMTSWPAGTPSRRGSGARPAGGPDGLPGARRGGLRRRAG